ncbi:MAG: hypothetical protein QM791_02120 [Ferruginibacter sp.]
MRYYLLLHFLLLTTICLAQDTSRIEQYCQVTIFDKMLSNKVTMDIDYGEERSLWKDYRLIDENGKLMNFNSVVDAVNYIGKLGWKLVNAFPVTEKGDTKEYFYFFKKKFSRSEIK